MKLFKIVVIIFGLFSVSINAEIIETLSPGNNISIIFRNDNNAAEYMVSFRGTTIVDWSKLGLNFKGDGLLSENLMVVSTERNLIDETYPIISGKSKYGRDHCNETKIMLKERSGKQRTLEIWFRAYNDGAAFRYNIPQIGATADFILSTEETQFNFAGDYRLWAMKKDRFRNSYEGEYYEYKVSNLFNKPGDAVPNSFYTTLPVTLEASNNLYFAITEAAITDYAGMYLVKGEGTLGLKSKLSPDTVYKDISVRGKTPAVTPWRVFIIGDTPGVLIESNIITSLNEPSKIGDASWVKAGRSTWSWWAEDRGFDPSFNYQILANHTVKYYIDFASQNGLEYVILDGGWYGWFDATKDDAVHDITKSLPELDLSEMATYANSKGIGLILWVVWYELENQFFEALDYYYSLGIKGIKVDFMDRDDQYMTDFYKRVADECAKRNMIVMYHGAYKPDGLQRTYPNILTYESVLGNESSRWFSDYPNPEHNVKLAFTRLVAGPMDFTPGSMTNVTNEKFVGQWKNPMTRGTRAQQMALLVVYQSGIVSLCESPKIYEQLPEFNFIKEVPATWDSTIVIEGQIADYIVIARKKGNDWFIGGITDWSSREITINLDFLEIGEYDFTSYSDGHDADNNPQNVKINTGKIKKGSKITVKLAKGGGMCMIFKKK